MNHSVFYHRIGQLQNKDEFIYTHPNKLYRVKTLVSDDGRYLLLTITHNSMNSGRLIADLRANGEINSELQFKEILPNLEAFYAVRKLFF